MNTLILSKNYKSLVMKKRIISFLAAFFVLSTVTSITVYTAYTVYLKYFIVHLTPAENNITAEHLNNPYRGWYHIYGQVLSDTDPLNETAVLNVLNRSAEITLLEINLCRYRTSDIGPNGLAQLDDLFSYWNKAGKQIILRFLYDWDGTPQKAEPDSISMIMRHMDQVAPVVNKYKSNIYLMQGTFIGAVGEMHSSNYSDSESMTKLIEHLANVIDPDIFLSVRTPAMWRTVNQTFDPITSDNAFQGTVASRLGLFNDGMFGSEYDLGTYGTSPLSEAKSFLAQGTLEDELAFQNQLCNYVPNGGEVVLNHPRSNFPDVLSPLTQMHVSYLDCDYDAQVLDKWRAATYTGSNCFQNTDGFTYIGEHLGYRYTIKSIDCSFRWNKDETAALAIQIENEGFAGSYRKFNSAITLVHNESGITYKLPLDFDNRFLSGGSKKTLRLKLPIRNYETGTYTIYFSMNDPELNRMILFANSFEQSTSHGYNVGTLSIRKH